MMNITDEHLVISKRAMLSITFTVIVTILTMAAIALYAAFERLGGASSADGRIVAIAAVAMTTALFLTMSITHIRSFRPAKVHHE